MYTEEKKNTGYNQVNIVIGFQFLFVILVFLNLGLMLPSESDEAF